MLKSKTLKSELAGAALALGILGSSPSFAQDVDTVVPVETPQVETVITADEPNAKWTVDPYNPQIPEGIIWALAILAAGSTLYAASRKMEGAWMRAGAALAAGIYLANPEIVSEQYQNLSSEALIMVDMSESQGLDGRDILTRESLAELETRLDQLGLKVTIVEFGDNGQGQGTNITEALQSGLSTIPTAQLGAVFVLSDGELHDIETVLDRVQLEAPIHGLISGEENEQDFRVAIERAPRYSDAGEDIEIAYSVISDHVLDDQNYVAEVVVRNNGQIVATQSVDEINELQTLNLPDLGRGNNNIEIMIEKVFRGDAPEVNLLSADVSAENNRITATIEGIGEEANVLVISGAPQQGTRHLRELFGDDPDVNFVHFAYLRPPEKEDETPLRYLATTAFPVHEVLNQNIEDYDVIVLDNYTYQGIIPLSYFDNIKSYVEDGGSLLVVGSDSLSAANGLGATSLKDILPLVPNGTTLEQTFQPQITETGERYPISRNLEFTLPQEQWGPWFSLAETNAREGSIVLMDDGNNHPLLAISEYGEGRIAMLASDQNWVWAKRQLGNGGGPADELISNLNRWLVFNQAMEEENIRLIPDGEQVIVELQTVGDEPEAVTITSPSGRTIEVTPQDYLPGLRRAFIDADELGVYRVERAGENPDFAFAQIGFADPLEMRRVISTPDLIAPVAAETGGVVARMNDIPLIKGFADITPEDEGVMGLKLSDEQELSGTTRYPIPPWVPMLLFAGFFAASLKREGGKPWRETLFGSKKKNEKTVKPEPMTPDMS